MTKAYDIAVLVGSLRKQSLNRNTAKALIGMAPDSLTLRFVEIGDLPFYNEAKEGEGAPAAWTRFRDEIRAAAGVLFVTPEYNRSVPAVMKNAIDVGSRPIKQNVWAGKPAAVISVSPGAIGGFGANHHLRQSLAALNVPLLPSPETYIGGAGKLFGEDGELINDGTRAFLKTVIGSFAAWVARNTE